MGASTNSACVTHFACYVNLFAVLLPYEQQNKYVIKNTMGQFVFVAVEESNLGQRCCVGTRRAFEMSVRDYRNFEVMRFVRPLKCDCACCFCCLQVHKPHILVTAPSCM
ncbi:hypothetical protein HPB48_009608 [Haemaphysalis longicornis]|uniref:Phospholipid scramblase n=1 Tax=Haemaphysalis longicornis TaxID=44386 RepID=A0A9J6FSI2_HAELO|nr:hypothetical protein HPB48_009608 [Haemaphysalis longicornis]